MKSAVETYNQYKDSEIPWTTLIPEDWGIQRAKWLFQKADRPVRDVDEVVTAFRDGKVTLRANRRTDGFTNALQEHGYQGIRRGDLVIHAMDAFAGAIGVSDSDGKSSPVYSACIPTGLFEVSPVFYAYLLRYVALSGYILSLAKGIRERSTDFRFNDFGEMVLPVPDVKTQHRIVNFLDEKTAEIDAAIAKKQRLIELLNEQKAILINRAVTRGLNPDVPMKDSGVEWIGEIPAHWSTTKLKYVSYVQSGITLGKSYSGNLRSYPYLRVANVQAGYFKLDDLATLELPSSVAQKHIIKPGDILVTEGGDLDKLGRGTVWRGEVDPCLHQNHVFSVRVTNAANIVNYVSLCMEADYGRKYFTNTANKTTNLASTNQAKLGNFPLIIPPVKEQERIVKATDEIQTMYNETVEVQKSEVMLLNELKQTLIANAVTGKIKL